MTKAAELAKMGEVLTNSQIGGRRNLIINGAMQVAQRGTSSAIGGGQAYHSVDRFIAQAFGADNFSGTLEQSTTVPSGQGFSNSLKYNIATAESAIDANELFDIRYKIEAQDLQQLANGTSSAKKITLSFWVRSHVTGTYSISINKLTNTTRLYPVLYTITSADTWEKKEIVIPGDTSGGGIDNSNEAGFQIVWGLSVSSTFNDGTGTNNQWQDYSNGAAFKGHTANAVGTQGAFYITGLQMEVGSQATPFEHRSFGEELLLCQRYLQRFEGVEGQGSNTDGTRFISANWDRTSHFVGHIFSPEMRSAPTIGFSSADDFYVYAAGSANIVSGVTLTGSGRTGAEFVFTTSATGTVGDAGFVRIYDHTNGFIEFRAEL